MSTGKCKAYLIIHVNTKTVPPTICGANITSFPLASLSSTGGKGVCWIEVLHVRGADYQDAHDKILRQVEGTEFCQFGDLRFLWPYLDPSMNAHAKRFEQDKLDKATMEAMPQNPDRPSGPPPWVTAVTSKIPTPQEQ